MERKKRNCQESIIQQHFIQWLKLQYPRVWEVTASFPNQGRRSAANASRMKAEGLKKGIPDVVIFQPSKGYHGMFIEFKHGKMVVSPEQRQMIELLTNRDYYCCTCWELETAIKELKDYLTEGYMTSYHC
jgi:hypothetical protein